MLPTAATCAQLFATYALRQWRLPELVAITEVVWCAVDLPLTAEAQDGTVLMARSLPRRIRVWDGLRSLDDDPNGAAP